MASVCLAFGVGETRCAVPVDRVGAVVHLSRSMSDGIDTTANRLKGLIRDMNCRDVPVVDVRREPSFPLEEYDKFSCVVLLNDGFTAGVDGRQVGVIADSLPMIAGFEWAPERAAAAGQTDVDPYYVIAHAKGHDDPAVHLLDITRVAEDGEVFAIESRPAGSPIETKGPITC